MIAVDTNILVYAHRRDSPWHEAAASCLTELAESPGPWAIPWPCVHEFYAIATHPRIYRPASTVGQAMDQLQAWFASPSLQLLSETTSYRTTLEEILLASQVVGPQVHDARIAALCRLHGVRQLWSADRDFSRFAGLDVVNPLVG